MKQKIYQVDSFTSKAFKGNPAAVCILKDAAEKVWMQNVAMEMNLSETAFLYPYKDGFNLRWFTPAVEVDLCGHATLACSYVLWETGVLNPTQQARFYTKSGLLTASKKGQMIEMDFPATPAKDIANVPGLAETLGTKVDYVGKNDYDYVALVDSEETLKNLSPDFGRLEKITERGVIVTSLSDSKGYDFVSRFFAPAAGINEDPVTGSAFCTLGPFWEKRLGKKKFIAYQASKRGGTVFVHVKDNRVVLGGRAVTVLKGELSI
jgi:PhzF family phenazine biosynthesis protein